MPDEKKIKLVAQNKKAYHDYEIHETLQAGIELFGTEVKSIRAGKCNLKDSYVEFNPQRQAFLVNMHVSPYEQGNIFNKDPLRKRRLLLHRFQINKLIGAVVRDGFTVVPTRVYFEGCYVKVDVAVAKGKKLFDKRESIARKDQEREIERAFRDRERHKNRE